LNPLPFSIVLPVKSEFQLLRKSLPSCYSVGPEEVLVCLDDPPHEETLQEAGRIASKFGFADRTELVRIPRNPEFRFHQAWVRREGFRKAKHDRILTVDVDLVINRNVLKAISLVGKDDVGLASCRTFHSIRGLLGLWRGAGHHLASRFYPPSLTGLYAIWRPYWQDSEEEAIRRLPDPRTTEAKGSFALIGEDAFLSNCMRVKHRCIHLPVIGGYSLRDDCNDRPRIQIEIGRYYAEKGYGFWKVLPVPHPDTSPYSGNMPYGATRQFWTKAIPMSFEDKPKTYDEKRRFRYDLQDYMHEVFQFSSFADKRVLDIGSGAGIDSAEFLRNGARVVSVDFSPLATNSTKLLLKELSLDGDVVLADAKWLPFRDSQFDVVYSFGVIHHVPGVTEVLDQVKRTLRKRGLFMGMVYNRDSLLYAYSIIYLHGIKEGLLAQGMSELEIASNFSERYTGNAYTKTYSKDEISNLLKRYFRSVWVTTRYNVIDTTDRRKVRLQLETGQTDLGWHLAFRSIK
jgi:SAM-dependent methyltransferase